MKRCLSPLFHTLLLIDRGSAHRINLVLNSLRLIGARAYLDRSGDSGRTHFVNNFVAFFDCREYLVPFSFDIGAICVQTCLETRLRKYLLTSRNVFSDRHAHAQGNDT